MAGGLKIVELGPSDADMVAAGAHLFDRPPAEEWTTRVLDDRGHHLLMALEDEQPVGFVTGVETAHPDKGVEMLVYELGVEEESRGRGIGTDLVNALAFLAHLRGCYAMWVVTQPGNAAALATYRAAGAAPPETAVVLEWPLAER